MKQWVKKMGGLVFASLLTFMLNGKAYADTEAPAADPPAEISEPAAADAPAAVDAPAVVDAPAAAAPAAAPRPTASQRLPVPILSVKLTAP